MSSYADIASHHVDGPQPRADTALLNTEPSPTTLPDVDSKVNVVPQSFKTDPVTVTSANAAATHGTSSEDESKPAADGSAKRRARKDRAKQKLKEAEDEGLQLWEEAKEHILRPGVMGGLVGIVNVGLIGAFGYQLYHKPHLRSDTRAISAAAVSALLLFGAEGYVAEAYRQTAAGQEEERRARQEGAVLYRRTKDVVLRPGVLGGFVGFVNIGILSGISYASYIHWDKPSWDRRTVSAVSVGLLTLFSVEGYMAEKYRVNEYPKRK